MLHTNNQYELQKKQDKIEALKRAIKRGNDDLVNQIYNNDKAEEPFEDDIVEILKEWYEKEKNDIKHAMKSYDDAMIEAFIGDFHHPYYEKILKKDSGYLGFSFWAFFFPYSFFLYRKLYAPLITLTIINIVISYLLSTKILTIILLTYEPSYSYLVLFEIFIGLICGFMAPSLVFNKYKKLKKEIELYFEDEDKRIEAMRLKGGKIPLIVAIFLPTLIWLLYVLYVSIDLIDSNL